MNILAIDLGFGSTKVAYIDPLTKELVLEKFISSVARLDSAPDECDNENVFQLQEDWYALGPDALKLPKKYLLPLHNYETLRVVTPVWITYLITRYKKRGITFDRIAIGLSLAYKDKADDILNHLSETLMTDRNFFICLPQGVAAKVALQEYGLSLDAANRTSFKYDNYLLLDIGNNTLDSCLIIKSMSTSNESIGLEGMGICRINYNIIDHIFKTTGIQIDLQQAKVILETGGQWRYRGRVYDLSERVHDFILSYFREVIDLFDTNPTLGDLIENVQKIIVIGGGCELFRQYRAEVDQILTEKGYPTDFWVLPEKNGEYFNALAYLLIGNKMFNTPNN